MNHGELTTVSVELADGYQHIRCVIVEVKRVPRNRRRRILNRFNGTKFAAMRPSDYILCYGVEPWEGSTAGDEVGASALNYFVNVGEPVMIGSDRLALEESERLSRLQKALESYQCHWRWLAEQSKLRPELRPDDVWIFQ